MAHIRAVLAARLWLQASPAWADGQPWWHSERRLRADRPAAGRREHVPDAEIHWPSIADSPYAGQVWAIEVELTPKPIARTTRIMTGLLSPMRYAQVVYLTAPPARPVVMRAAGGLPVGTSPGWWSGSCPPPRSPRSGVMSVWSWVKLTVCLWLLRKMIKAGGWLLLAAIAVAAWPVTLVAGTGYGAAWLRGWPPARLRRTAAWALLPAGIWLAIRAARRDAWRPVALTPVQEWQRGWSRLAAPEIVRAFVLLAPFVVPAGLALAALAWAWRIYAITTGLGGIMATAPITFDARQWKRQVRTARGLTAAPGAVPLLGRGGRIPVGGTIRSIGHRWHPVFTIPAAACARHMVIVGATGSGKTNLMMRLWAGWFTAALAAARAGKGHRPLLVVLDCKGGRDARVKACGLAACCTGRAPAGSRSGPTKRGCPCGTCRRGTWPCCCTRWSTPGPARPPITPMSCRRS